MKSVLFYLSLCLFAGVLLLLVTTCFDPPSGHYDFTLRMNELSCVRMRINPYDVWSEKISLPPYYPNTHVGAPPEGCTERVNAYAPWEYVYMLPFAYLPRTWTWPVYCLLMAASLVVLLRLSGFERTKDGFLASAVPFLLLSYTIWSNTAIGNFAIIVLAAAVAMAWALNRGREWLAGLCWALVMVKPQIGLIFAIPLLMRLKWRTCVLAGSVCLLASFFAAVICKAPLVDMLLQGPAANTSFFLGCGTWPKFLCGTFAGNGDIVAGAVVGALVCLVMTGLVRKERDWFVFLMPAAITSCCWTYTQAYSHAMGWFVAFVVVRELLKRPHSRFLWTLAALSAFSLSRWPLAWHGLFGFAGWDFPMSEYAFRCLDSLNSTLSLSIAFFLCLWFHRNFRTL